jgi:hypothetical protein
LLLLRRPKLLGPSLADRNPGTADAYRDDPARYELPLSIVEAAAGLEKWH